MDGGEVFAVIASGPSLTQADCDLVKKHCVTLAVSDAYKLIEADYHYSCDQAWWKVHIDHVKAGRRFTQYGGEDERLLAISQGLEPIEGKDLPGLGLDCIHTNRNSGAQAINLAFLLGAKRIILLGFDMQWTDGKSHFFGDHPEGLRNKDPTIHIPHFTQLAADLEREGVEVINCTRETALHQFKRATLEQVI
jgi:hypothetical protein